MSSFDPKHTDQPNGSCSVAVGQEYLPTFPGCALPCIGFRVRLLIMELPSNKRGLLYVFNPPLSTRHFSVAASHKLQTTLARRIYRGSRCLHNRHAACHKQTKVTFQETTIRLYVQTQIQHSDFNQTRDSLKFGKLSAAFRIIDVIFNNAKKSKHLTTKYQYVF